MPSTLHETLIEMFRHRPSLAAELLTDALGVDVPAHQDARLDPGEFTDVTPTEYRADAVVVLGDAGTAALAVVVEVQLGRDEGKRFSWPVYLSTLRARLRCPVVLLVVCVDAAASTWCARPIELGHPGFRLVPLVVGPDRVPMVTDPARAARFPELAVLSALAHGARPDSRGVLDALVGALSIVDEQHAALYADLVLAALPAVAHRYLEELMSAGLHEYQSEFVRKYIMQGRAEGRAEGRASGEARAILAVLDARGLVADDDVRERVTACTDLDVLDGWLRRAATATSADDLFD